jgi:hypothetical protein
MEELAGGVWRQGGASRRSQEAGRS